MHGPRHWQQDLKQYIGGGYNSWFPSSECPPPGPPSEEISQSSQSPRNQRPSFSTSITKQYLPPSNRQKPSVAGKYYHSLPLRLPSRVAQQIQPVRPSSSPLPLPSCSWRHLRSHRPSSSACNRAAGKAVSVSFECLWVSVRVCKCAASTRLALPCRPRIASKVFEKSCTWTLFPINKRMGYDVDRRPRTNRNKETSPLSQRREKNRKGRKKKPILHTHTHAQKSSRH